jgi:hypothetical protein
VKQSALTGIEACESRQSRSASVDVVSKAPPYHREATYAAKPEHLEGRAPRSAIDPLELNWDPARERRVVEAGIVSGCADFSR